jgi:hypothetical protein
MPTVLDVVGIKPPASFNGVAQTPIDGVSLRYSFNDAKAPEQHRTQYFEVFGNASLYKDGWFVASPVPAGGLTPGVAANAPRWQLYDLKTDYSQTTDVADRFPDKLTEMRAAFDSEARRNKVFPISYAGLMDIIPQNRPEVTARAGSFTFYPSNMRYAEGVFPSINNRRLIAAFASAFLCGTLFAGSMVVFAVGMGRRIMGLRGEGPSNVRYARSEPRLAVQRQLRNGPAYVPAGTPRHALGAIEFVR